jgi:hypothetical protein
MFARLHLQKFEKEDGFNLTEHLLEQANLRAFGCYTYRKQYSIVASTRHVMDISIVRVDDEYMSTRLASLGKEEDVVLMIPVSALYHVVTYLHSMMVVGWKDDHFGDNHKLMLKVRNKYAMSEDLAFEKLLAPFRGLYGFRKAKIIGMKRTDRVKKLEDSLWKSSCWGSYTQQDMHKWVRQVAKLFFTTYKLHKSRPQGAAARDAWHEVQDSLMLGCTWYQHVNELWGSELYLLQRMLFWTGLQEANCTMNLLVNFDQQGPAPEGYEWGTLASVYEKLLDRCSDNTPLFHMPANMLPEATWYPEKLKIQLYHA